MIHTCNHIDLHTMKASNYDPTHTTTLRNAFAAEMRKRFRRLRGVINKAIIDDDCFGLRGMVTMEMTSPGHKAFDFPRDSKKMSAFMAWLERQVQDGILDVGDITQVGESVDAAWTNKYILDTYQKGIYRARYDMINAGYDVPRLSEAGIQVSMQNPLHVERVGMLYTRTFRELKGVTDAMGQQISRVLAEGMSEGLGPREIARSLNATVSGKNRAKLGITDRLGRAISAERRATILARTEIIKAHADSKLNEFKAWRMEGVQVQAEWVTAGSGVCEICEGLEGQVMSLEEAEGMLPRHPQCRCTFIPAKKG